MSRLFRGVPAGAWAGRGPYYTSTLAHVLSYSSLLYPRLIKNIERFFLYSWIYQQILESF